MKALKDSPSLPGIQLNEHAILN